MIGPLNQLTLLYFAVFLSTFGSLCAQVPGLLNYQGRVIVDGTNFDGPGLFRFALVNADGTETFWSNDGSSSAGSEPSNAVSLTVSKGLYSVLLGNTSLTNMTVVPSEVFSNPDVRLRVWFDDGSNGSLLLSPDQRISAVGYAMVADRARQVHLTDIITAPLDPVISWGSNTLGQSAVPSSLSNVTAVAGGGGHSLVLIDNGTVQAWGDNSNGQSSIPAGLAGVTQISAGASHSLARKSDGSVVAWGNDTFGQSTVPDELNTVISVAAGEKHSLALRADGTLHAWGNNSFSQTTIPASAAGITAIAAGYDHCLALKSDGTIVAWGRNDIGQATVPADLTNVVAIAAGAYHSLAVKNDGTVVAWGWNTGEQTDVPPGLSNVISVTAGRTFSAALMNDGTVEVWGDNSFGQRTLPTELDQIQMLAAGSDHLIALQNDLIPAEVARLDQANQFTAPIGIGRVAATNILEVEGNASKSTAGNWAANSDQRIKTDIKQITGALALINRVHPVTFRYTTDYLAQHPAIPDVPYYNVIAQEFKKVFPNAVQGSGEHLADGSEILQVDTYPATITTIAAVQELSAKLSRKDAELKALKARMAKIEDYLQQLQTKTPLEK